MAMHAAAVKRRVGLAEYLAFERSAEAKHILWDGEIFPMWGMAGGSTAHNTIAANAIGAAVIGLRGSACRALTSDQKVWVPRKGGVVYPDVTLVCGPLSLHEGTTDVVDNPVAIIEVLSPGTESFDRAEKFEGYRSIPTLQHYLMVSSTDPHVEHYERTGEGVWALREYRAGDTLTLSTPTLSLVLDELYDRAFDTTR